MPPLLSARKELGSSRRSLDSQTLESDSQPLEEHNTQSTSNQEEEAKQKSVSEASSRATSRLNGSEEGSMEEGSWIEGKENIRVWFVKALFYYFIRSKTNKKSKFVSFITTILFIYLV